MPTLLKSAMRWLARRPSYMLLTASDESLAAEPPGRFAGASWGLMVLSLGFGMVLLLAASWSWSLFRDFGRLIMPTLAVTAVFVLWPFRRAMASLAELLAGRDTTTRALAAATLVLFLAMCVLRASHANYHEYFLPRWLAWLRPENELLRVLLVMPLWGGVSMLLSARFAGAGADTEPAVAAFARGCGPLAMVACLAAVLYITIQYFNFLPWYQLAISAATLIVAVVGGAVLSRRTGGLTRRALLATSALTQLGFLAAYLAVRNLRLW